MQNKETLTPPSLTEALRMTLAYLRFQHLADEADRQKLEQQLHRALDEAEGAANETAGY